MPARPPSPSTFSLAPLANGGCATTTHVHSSFDTLIKTQFEHCRRAGNILRNDPLESDVLRKNISGTLGLIAEYEPSLFAHKRAATVGGAATAKAKIINMEEPFNPNKFNFTKVAEEEVLLYLQDNNEVIHPILVNVSPLMYGHGLLIPFVEQGLPQQLTSQAVGLAIDLLISAKSCEFCIGFNSLGAFSSVNHLHMHILYPGELDHETRIGGTQPLMKGRKDFPIAYAPIQQTITQSYNNTCTNGTTGSGEGCQVDLVDWMLPCFSFQTTSTSTAALQLAVTRFVRFLHRQRIPHNVLFLLQQPQEQEQDATSAPSHPQIRIIVIPRKPQHCFDSTIHGFNAALGEISGMLIAKTHQQFDAFQETTIRTVMKQYVACDEAVLADILLELKGGGGGGTGEWSSSCSSSSSFA